MPSESTNIKKTSLLTQDHKIFRGSQSPVNPVSGDLLGALLGQGPEPDADVGGDDVHHAKAGDALELVNVQLKLKKKH